MTTAEQRAALRESIQAEEFINTEEHQKIGLAPAKEAEAEATPEAEPVAESEEIPPETPPEGEAEPVEEPEEPAEETVSKKTFERRVAKEIEKTRLEREKREALEARLAALEKKEGKTDLTPAEIREQARLEAKQEIIQEQFKIATDNLISAAEKEIPNFNKRYAEFSENVAPLPREAVETLLQLENGHSVLNHIMKNPDWAATFMGMNEKKQSAELGKLSEKLAAPKPKPLSKAPAPLAPLGGASRANVSAAASDTDSMEVFAAKRQKAHRERVYR